MKDFVSKGDQMRKDGKENKRCCENYEEKKVVNFPAKTIKWREISKE